MVEVRILITGITGFVGSHLAEYALAQGTEVVGTLRWRSKTEHIEHLRDRISLFESDLRDLLSVRALLEQARPDYIVHLAAQSFVVASWTTRGLFTTLSSSSPRTRTGSAPAFASSAHVGFGSATPGAGS